MDGDETRGQERWPGAPASGGRRRPVAPPGAARVAALDALLRDIDDLRRTLETDLTLAAGAVDAGAPDVAASLLAADRVDLAGFEERALSRLRDLEAADAVEDLTDDLETGLPPEVVVTLRPRRRSRLARLLPAAPMVAAAAALVGFLGVVPSGSSRPAPTELPSSVLSSWAELERLTATDAPPEQVQRAARDLNAVIATMVARADGDPVAARRALDLLREAEVVLSSDDDAAQLQQVLRQSRDLAARLLASLPPVPRPTAERTAPASPLPLPLPERDDAERQQDASERDAARPTPARIGGPQPAASGRASASAASSPSPAAPDRSAASRPASPSPSPSVPVPKPLLPSSMIDPV